MNRELIEQPKYVSDDIFEHVIAKTRTQLNVLNSVYKNDIEKATLFGTICDIVCSYFNTSMEDVIKYRLCRNTEYKIIRQVLVYFLVEYLYPHLMKKIEIGKALGYHYSTVIYHYEQVLGMISIGDRKYVKIITEISKAIDETR